MNKLSTGSGLIKYSYDLEEKKVKIDFSGNDGINVCFRNDASILFFAATSYCNSYICISRELNIRFEKGKSSSLFL